MKRIIVFFLISLAASLSLHSEEVLRVVPVSTSIPEHTYLILSQQITSATLVGVPTYPRGVSTLNKLYSIEKRSFININYPSIVTEVQRGISIVSADLVNMTPADWNIAYNILEIGTISAFAMRKYPLLDKILWNMIKWFPEKELKGRAIPPDLYLRWRKINDGMVKYKVEFEAPVSDVIVRVDGREISNFTTTLPAGVHQIYWETPYEKQVVVKHIYSDTTIKLGVFPVPISKIREIVVAEGWCSGQLDKLFEDSGISYPILFIDTLQPHYVLADPVIGGIILEGGEEILPEIAQVIENYQNMNYVPSLTCKWEKIPFYEQWWFYMGIGAVVGGVGAGIWYHNLGGRVVVSW